MYMSDIEKEDGIYKMLLATMLEFKFMKQPPISLWLTLLSNRLSRSWYRRSRCYGQISEKAAENAEYITELKYEFMAHDDDVFEELTQTAERWWEDYADFAACFEGQREHMPQLYLLKDLIVAGGSSVDISSLKSQYDSFMSNVLNSFVEEVGNNDPAFNYGAEFDDLNLFKCGICSQGRTNQFPQVGLYMLKQRLPIPTVERRGVCETRIKSWV